LPYKPAERLDWPFLSPDQVQKRALFRVSLLWAKEQNCDTNVHEIPLNKKSFVLLCA
jgi:hypothetical protein